jgi:hypothetical protein
MNIHKKYLYQLFKVCRYIYYVVNIIYILYIFVFSGVYQPYWRLFLTYYFASFRFYNVYLAVTIEQTGHVWATAHIEFIVRSQPARLSPTTLFLFYTHCRYVVRQTFY